jgi:hypothetical protein
VRQGAEGFGYSWVPGCSTSAARGGAVVMCDERPAQASTSPNPRGDRPALRTVAGKVAAGMAAVSLACSSPQVNSRSAVRNAGRRTAAVMGETLGMQSLACMPQCPGRSNLASARDALLHDGVSAWRVSRTCRACARAYLCRLPVLRELAQATRAQQGQAAAVGASETQVQSGKKVEPGQVAVAAGVAASGIYLFRRAGGPDSGAADGKASNPLLAAIAPKPKPENATGV